MKNNLLIQLSLLFVIASCTSKIAYLPDYKVYHKNIFGANIELNMYSLKSIEGELITVDTGSVTILDDYSHQCISVAKKDIESFSVRYANPPQYIAWNVVNSLFTLTHGIVLLLTLPINITTMVIINRNAQKAYEYEDSHINYEQLRMFARFPQGLPRNVNLANLKNGEK